MVVKDKTNFVYNGVDSSDLGIINVNVDTGLAEEPFLSPLTIHSVPIKGRTKPYFMGITYTPLILRLSFGFIKTWDEDLIREIAQIFHVDNYKPLWFHDYEDSIFFCMPAEESFVIHNNLRQGYLELEMYCNDIYAYSRLKEQTIDVADLGDFILHNQGDVDIYPEILLQRTSGVGNIAIRNLTNNSEITFSDLPANEELYIDGENEMIINETSTNVFRYDKHNGQFLTIQPGINHLESEGLSALMFRWRFKTLQI